MTESDLKQKFCQRYSFETARPILDSLFPQADKYFNQSLQLEADDRKARSVIQRGRVTLNDGRNLALFEVEVADTVNIQRNRQGLRDIALRYIDQHIIHGALVFYYSPRQTDYRLSLIAKTTELTEDGDLVTTQTAPKRFTYVLGPNEPCTTAAKQFRQLLTKSPSLTLQDVIDAFSVERLNKAFFKRYKEHYEQFWIFIAERNEYAQALLDKDKPTLSQQQKPIRDFVKKLLGRLVFLQFLQKKGWMGVPANRIDWKEGDINFTRHLFQNSPDKDRFYSQRLVKLFFETLNTDQNKRPNYIFPITGTKVPYLNGGLFDNDTPKTDHFDFPSNFFAELFDSFDQFNFTIDENSPDEQEVGIDPEMLGHIFENLLEENREKGAFYTPKEVVHYMCQESLIQYLRTHLPECKEDDSPATKAIEKFIRTNDVGNRINKKNYVVQNANRIERLLDAVKICDPAIGSGAFPMGLLQEIFQAKLALDLTLDRAEAKKHIIQNSIYGVDIEKGAVDIARLRFWLALVVDEDEPQPLPNLDYKIMQGNSLLESFEGIDLHFEPKRFEVKIVKQVDLFGNVIDPQISIAEYLQSKQAMQEFDLTELEETYFTTNDPAEKARIRAKIDQFERDFINEQINKQQEEKRSLIETKQKKAVNHRDLKAIEQLTTELSALENSIQKLVEITSDNKPYFLWHLYFMEVFTNGGFDIVIGNPPYGTSLKGRFRDEVVTKFGKLPDFEIYYYFIELARTLLKNDGLKSYIIPNTFLFNVFAANYRNSLIENWQINMILDCTAFSIFENATVRNAITFFKKRTKQNVIGYKNTKNANSFSELISHSDEKIKVKDLLLSNQNWGLAFKLDTNTNNLITNIKRLHSKLSEYFTGISQGLIAYDKYQGQDADTIKNRSFHYSQKIHSHLKEWLWGEDIRRYSITWNGKEWIDYNANIANPRQPKFFKGPRILIREITNPSIYAAYTEEEKYHDPSIIVVLNSDSYSLKVALGILNSRLATFFHFNSSPKATKGAFPKILVEDIKNFPLPNTNNNSYLQIELLVNEVLNRVTSGKDTQILENQIDALVFDIYELSENQMLLVLDSSKDLSIKDRTQIHNDFRNIRNRHFYIQL